MQSLHNQTTNYKHVTLCFQNRLFSAIYDTLKCGIDPTTEQLLARPIVCMLPTTLLCEVTGCDKKKKTQP